MKIIALAMLTIVALDFGLAALFFSNYWLLLGVVAALAGFGLIAYQLGKRPRLETDDGWELGETGELTDPDKPQRVRGAKLSARFLKLGFLAIGSPGSGKTESIALGFIYAARQFAQTRGWAYFEGKGDTDIYKKCVAMSCTPNHFFSTELPGSASINLFAGEAHDVIDRLSQILISTTTTTSYYSDIQRTVLNKVIPLLANAGAPANLRDLYVALSVEDAGRELTRRARAAGVDGVTISLAQQWINIPIEERIEEISGLLNRLFVFVSGPYADRLNCYQPDIDIARAMRAGESIYFHLPLTYFARDVAIAIVEMFNVEARKRQLGGTNGLAMYPLIFDDWGAFFHGNFGPFSARCRSAAMPLNFSFQSVAQLHAVSPHFADELDDTVTTKIILRVQGAATAKYAGNLLGEYDVHEVSVSELGTRDGTNLSHQRRFRIEPRMLRSLQEGEAYISTLQRENGLVTNPLWRARFPLPPLDGWRDVPMPAPRAHTEGDGLAFWHRYMDPTRLAEIHTKIQEAAKKQGIVERDEAALRALDARTQLAANPGLLEQMEASA